MSAVLKMFLGSVVAAVLYGIIHDMVTAHICVEYFSRFHPPTPWGRLESPLLNALYWGVVATWWVGAPLGLMVGLCARVGSWPRLEPGRVMNLVARQLCVLFVFAMGAMAMAYWQGFAGVVRLRFSPDCPDHVFHAVWVAHNVSYFLGALLGLALCCEVLLLRMLSSRAARVDKPL